MFILDLDIGYSGGASPECHESCCLAGLGIEAGHSNSISRGSLERQKQAHLMSRGKPRHRWIFTRLVPICEQRHARALSRSRSIPASWPRDMSAPRRYAHSLHPPVQWPASGCTLPPSSLLLWLGAAAHDGVPPGGPLSGQLSSAWSPHISLFFSLLRCPAG